MTGLSREQKEYFLLRPFVIASELRERSNLVLFAVAIKEDCFVVRPRKPFGRPSRNDGCFLKELCAAQWSYS
jgi:hypothetical protein